MAILYEVLESQGGTWEGSDNFFSGIDGVHPGNEIYGDAFTFLLDFARGGNDTLIGGDSTQNFLVGDASSMLSSSQGGNDSLVGGDFSRNTLLGDAFAVDDNAQVGDDTLVGGAHCISNSLYGDVLSTFSSVHCGNDVLIAGTNSANQLFGDAGLLRHTAHGGNDTLFGASAGDLLAGDSSELAHDAMAGDDLLIASDHGNQLIGDALLFSGAGFAGNDTLIGGTGSDVMVGDGLFLLHGKQGGHDTFVFASNSGQDIIHDFESGKDLLDLSALDLLDLPGRAPAEKLPSKASAALQNSPATKTDFAALDSNGDGILDDADDCLSAMADGQGTVIDLGAACGGPAGANTVTLLNVTTLTQTDFVF